MISMMAVGRLMKFVEARILVGSGAWRLRSAEAFQFFPGTDALETLAVFDRVS
jgi:hypothetical protein